MTKNCRHLKQFVFCGFTAGLFFLSSSCCTKKDCEGFDDLNEIQMLNFVQSDVDSIALEIYANNSNFATRIDSSFTSAHGRTTGDNQLIIFLTEHINQSHDYKITLISTGQVFKLTNFVTKKEECNCPSDKYNVLDSYYLNGQKINSSSLTITH